ncbi:ChaN family lipoprotein [Niveibacterium microcysteis]|uniref:ChaN family lipoprotein n=1 Tax=Niveibacterium microcysteis TaxID=2811415 RepID=A0ABX7MA53_9RHOO|nr:ChaN family lipoprotein [Niveibacterium microcysteis]QSI78597.1 ChaN family lipoprotein [Niveibacterium microcysteis]
MTRTLLTALLAAVLAGGPITQALATQPDPATLAHAIAPYPLVLLGEVHDNPQVHQLRLDALRLRIAAGWRPALVMEHFDRERQADIDRARSEHPRDVDHLIEQAGDKRWPWPMLKPLLVLALDHDLPIIAANVSRADAGRAMREGLGAALPAEVLAAAGLPQRARPVLEDELVAGQQRSIDAGHCGQTPPDMLPGLVQAQVARDLFMAAQLRAQASRGAVLLAGNGHVRRDIGVPLWLADLPGVFAVSLGEDDSDAAKFDLNFTLPAVERDDPCAALAKPASR